MNINDKVFVAGHNGMVGSAIMRVLLANGYKNIITATYKELDLRDSAKVALFFKMTKPDFVFLSAAKVGGINANRLYPADFLYDNLQIQNNVIHQSYKVGVKKLVFLGTSCIYPRECPQPMKEEYLLSGPLEPTNEGYALAKIAGLKLAQFYQQQYGLHCINPMPCNLYGTNDSFDPNNSHVLSALVKKFVDTWKSPEIINVGWGTDISIKELAYLIAEKAGYQGEIKWDTSMPDGMLRKCLDVSRLSALGYKPRVSLREGVALTIEEYRERKRTGDLT